MVDRASWLPRLVRLALLLFAAVLVVAVGAAGCGRSGLVEDELTILPGDAGPRCGPSNCAGCCEGNTCVAGTALKECGVAGAQCGDCTRASVPATCQANVARGDGGVAAGGSCVAKARTCDCPQGYTCNTSTGACISPSPCGVCAGCCEGTVCQPGTSTTSCGENGASCGSCAIGLGCVPGTSGGGVCVSTACGPNNCAGCCGPAGCTAGTLVTACGTLGQACESCTGGECAPAGPNNGGVCVATGCNAQNCPGCCDANGLCQSGTAAAACGGNGGACLACSSTEVCAGGACGTPAGCGPQSCAGCCQGNNCVGGGANGACGAGGAACQDCGTTATCLGNVCQTAGPCDATSCPTGCCQGNLCLAGLNDSSCGSGGGACSACGAGAQCAADPAGAGGSCQVGAACGASNCSGCCVNNQCVGGTSLGACGVAGNQCQACGTGTVCVNGSCEATCGAVSCSGCCQGGVCGLGGQTNACGTGGATCQNCGASGGSCQNGACVAQPCGPGTCAGCCDASGACVGGAAAGACGVGGNSCSDCGSIGDVCSQGACVTTPPVCSPANCPLGCCDASGVCQDGFLANQCGSGGIACLDCTATSASCAVNQTPRGCTGVQTTCPATYAGCPAGTITPSPSVQTSACTPQDLTEAAAACVGGPDTTGCTSFLKTLTSNGEQGCALCLQPFVVPFAQATGIFLCAAPFLPSSCNQATGCFTDCEIKVCNQCPASGLAACQGQTASGSCAAYTQGATCVLAAENGPGAFCNPTAYSDFGAWLKGVGGNYCE